MNKIVILTGPTGIGKSASSINVAKHFNTSIINGDAFQVYKNMDIGTAKPSQQERKEAKHELFDIIDSAESFSVADYQRITRAKIDEIIKNGQIPFIVGGSGLYLESIFYSYDFSSPSRSADFEQEMNKYSNEELYQKLKDLSLSGEELPHPNNRKRVLLALQKKMNHNDVCKDLHLVYEPLVIFLDMDREKLYDKINNRVDQMINFGLIEEVKYLYDNHAFSKTSKEAIGYKQLIDYFDGNLSHDEAINLIKQLSRNYAKRQLTWFRHKDYTHVIDRTNLSDEELSKEIIKLIEEFI